MLATRRNNVIPSKIRIVYYSPEKEWNEEILAREANRKNALGRTMRTMHSKEMTRAEQNSNIIPL